MPRKKVAVIGVGRLGAIHARIYKQLSSAQLVAVCDINKERALSIARTLGVKACFAYRELFAKVEAVSIAVPTSLHCKVACDFLRAGIDVLLEKPIAPDLTEARNIIKAQKTSGRILQVGHVERFNSAFAAVKAITSPPRFIECHRLSPYPFRSLDVSVILDVMIHDIDIVLGLVRSPLKKVEAVGVKVLSRSLDIVNARLTFADGCIANLTASRVSEAPMRKIRLFFKNTYISLDYANQDAFLYRKKGKALEKKILPIEKEEPLKKEISAFLDCCRKRTPPLVGAQEATEALKLALQIERLCQKRYSL